MPDYAARNQTVTASPGTGQLPRQVRLADLQTIAHLRIEETLVLVREHIRQSKLTSKLGSGIVLTGGGARLKKVDQLAEKIFGLPCRIGKPREVSGMTEVMERPECAAVVGMLRYAGRSLPASGSIWVKLRKKVLGV